MKALNTLLLFFILSIPQTINAKAIDLITHNNDRYDSAFQSYTPTILHEEYIIINPDIFIINAQEISKIRITLFNSLHVVAIQDKVISDVLLSSLWIGSIAGEANSSVILAISPTSISGKIKIPGRVFFIRFINDQQLLREVAVTGYTDNWSSQLDEAKEKQVYAIVNEERKTNNLPQYNYDNQLAISSRLHSEDMAQNNYFSHTSRDGRSPFDRIKAQGYQYNRAGENIAAGASTAEQAMELWMNSAGHRAAILSRQFCDIGVGYGFSSSNRYKHLWTQNFGKKQRTQSCKDNPGDDGDLVNGKPKTNLAGSRGQWLHYKLTVPQNAQNLSITIQGGSGDADLYMKFAKKPTLSNYDCRPYLVGNEETCKVNNPSSGVYYISIMGYSTFSGLTLTANFEK